MTDQQAPFAPFNPPLPRGRVAMSWPRWPARVWPAHTGATASARVLLAALTAGIVGAATLHVQVIGAGYLMTGVTILVAGLAASRARPSRWQLSLATSAAALLSVAAIRSAPWLVVLCVLLACVVGSLALLDARTWSGLALGSVVSCFVPVRTIRWTSRGLAGLRFGSSSPKRVVVVLGVTGALLVVFRALFISADAAYAKTMGVVLPFVSVPEAFGRIFVFACVALGALGAAYVARRPPVFDALAPGPSRPLQWWEWVVPLAVLDVLFASFVAVQLTVLFGGRRHVLSTVGLTYAEYARQGFWQLLAVTVLTLGLLAVAIRKTSRQTRRDRALVRVLLGVLTLQALVIVLSAIHRMSIYEQEYGFTRLRVFVNAVEFWLGAVLVLVVVAGVRLSGAWLPRAVVASVIVALLGLAAINPDAYIARHNIDRFIRTGRIDPTYLATLSADAIPELGRLPVTALSCEILESSADRTVVANNPWYNVNIGRMRARRVLLARPARKCAAGMDVAGGLGP